MSETIKRSWLEDNEGNKIAPRTFASQITTDDGILLEKKIEDDLSEVKSYVDEEIAAESAAREAETASIKNDVKTLQEVVINGGGSGGGTGGSGTVTKEQIGLGNVDNTSDMDKPVSTATQTALDEKANQSDLTSHTENKENPHEVTKEQIGLGNVDNTSDASKPVSTATQAALDKKADSSDLTSHIENKENPHEVTKSQVGLGNVDNTSDASKPVSTAQKTAIDTAYSNAKTYTDEKIAGLINGAPTTLDTLGEIATAMEENKDVVDSLDEAIGKKANQSDLTAHTGNTTNHITSTERTNWNAAKTHADSAHAPSNAEANQNAFSNVKVGSTTIAADSKTDTLTLEAGSNITITPDATNDKITIAATDTTYSAATTTTDGLMSSDDKTKLDATNVAFGTCSTAADVAAKVITISGNTNWKLAIGSIITVKFTNTNTAQNPTFNVNGTGAKPVWYNTYVITTSSLAYAGTANRPMKFVYDGTQYVFIGHSLDNNSDTKATQTNTTTDADYRLVLSTNANNTTETNTLRKSGNFTANPSTGAFYAKGFDRITITGQTLDVDTLTLSTGSPEIMKYICKTSGGSNNISNIPVSGSPFILDVELIRWASTTDYITKQTFVSTGDKHKEYVRYCTNGTWETSWTKRLFTDNNTTYSAATTSANGLMSKEDKSKLDITNIAYATCSTAAATAAKVATIDGNTNWTLQKGSIVVVKYTNTNTASNVTLNVNNTGAKSIWYNTAVYTGNSNIVGGAAGRITTFMYDGTNWVWMGQGSDANSTYSPATLGQGYGTCTTAAATTAKVVTLSSYALVVGGIVAVKFTYAVPASATMNINSKGAKAIYNRGAAIAANVIKAGDIATFIYNGSQYHLLTVDRDNNTTYSAATTSANGLMSSTDKTKLEATNIAYGTCSTAAATAAKVITISGNTNWKLAAGSMITVKFTNTNTAQNPTFNVNSTGAKSVWYNTALITTGSLAYAGTANRPMNFVYDGTQYVFIGWSVDSNTTYSQARLGQGYGTCTTAAATTAKVVTLSSYALATGGIVSVKFTYAVPANATMNINSKGAKAIYYKGAAITAGVIAAGDVATFIYNGSQYHLISIDTSYENAKKYADSKISDTITESSSTAILNTHEGGLVFKEIKGNSQKLTSTGKNLANPATFNFSKGISTTTGGFYDDENLISTDYIDVSGLSSIAWNFDIIDDFIWGVFYDSSKTLVAYLHTDKHFTNVPSNAKYVRVTFANKYNGRAMINEGSVPLPYEPYGTGIQFIRSVMIDRIKTRGKNLLPYYNTETNHTESGIEWTDLRDGRIMANGTTSTVSSEFTITVRTSGDYKLPAGSYILSGCPSVSGCSLNVGKTSTSGSWESVATCTGSEVTFTLSEDTDLGINLRVATNKTVSNVIFEPMIRKAGITNNTWEPYKESSLEQANYIGLNKIGDVYDVVANSMYTRKITRKRITSSYEFYNNSSWSNTKAFRVENFFDDGVPVGDDGTNWKLDANILCAHADTVSASEISNNTTTGFNGVAQNQGKNLFLSFSDCATVDALKTFLDNNEVYVYYELAEPVIKPVRLGNLRTFDEVTYVEIDSELQPEIVVEYGTNEVGCNVLANSVGVGNMNAILQNNVLPHLFHNYGWNNYKDANSCIRPGIYANSTFTNVPYQNGILLVFAINESVIIQINTTFSGDGMAIRTYWWGTWYSWRAISTSAIS